MLEELPHGEHRVVLVELKDHRGRRGRWSLGEAEKDLNLVGERSGVDREVREA